MVLHLLQAGTEFAYYLSGYLLMGLEIHAKALAIFYNGVELLDVGFAAWSVLPLRAILGFLDLLRNTFAQSLDLGKQLGFAGSPGTCQELLHGGHIAGQLCADRFALFCHRGRLLQLTTLNSISNFCADALTSGIN